MKKSLLVLLVFLSLQLCSCMQQNGNEQEYIFKDGVYEAMLCTQSREIPVNLEIRSDGEEKSVRIEFGEEQKGYFARTDQSGTYIGVGELELGMPYGELNDTLRILCASFADMQSREVVDSSFGKLELLHAEREGIRAQIYIHVSEGIPVRLSVGGLSLEIKSFAEHDPERQ